MREDDLPIFFEHQQDPEATRMAAFPSRARDAFMTHWAKILADQTVVKKNVLFDGHVAGNIVSWEHSGERDVGYWIGRDYWGKGVATQGAISVSRSGEDAPSLRARRETQYCLIPGVGKVWVHNFRSWQSGRQRWGLRGRRVHYETGSEPAYEMELVPARN